jgi:hypothetical protein
LGGDIVKKISKIVLSLSMFLMAISLSYARKKRVPLSKEETDICKQGFQEYHLENKVSERKALEKRIAKELSELPHTSRKWTQPEVRKVFNRRNTMKKLAGDENNKNLEEHKKSEKGKTRRSNYSAYEQEKEVKNKFFQKERYEKQKKQEGQVQQQASPLNFPSGNYGWQQPPWVPQLPFPLPMVPYGWQQLPWVPQLPFPSINLEPQQGFLPMLPSVPIQQDAPQVEAKQEPQPPIKFSSDDQVRRVTVTRPTLPFSEEDKWVI